MSSEDEENVVCAVYAHSYTATPRGSLHPTGSPPSLAHITSAAGGSVPLQEIPTSSRADVAVPGGSGTRSASRGRRIVRARRSLPLQDYTIAEYLADSGSDDDDDDDAAESDAGDLGGIFPRGEIRRLRQTMIQREEEENVIEELGDAWNTYDEAMNVGNDENEGGMNVRNDEIEGGMNVGNDENEGGMNVRNDEIEGGMNVGNDENEGRMRNEGMNVGPDRESTEFLWSDDFTSFTAQKETYRRDPGPTFISQDPAEIFLEFWDAGIMGLIADETNKYARQYIETYTDPDLGTTMPKYLDKWEEVTIEVLYQYFAVMICMSFCLRSKIQEYWEGGLMGMPMFRQMMTRDQFLLITKFLHFVSDRDSSERGYERKIGKIAPILDHCNRKFSALYIPEQHISLDESLLLWKGRLSWRQCIRSKAARFGIKSFDLCEATTGYLLKCKLYTGKETPMHLVPIHGFANKTAQVVLELMEGYLDAGHVLVMDNWYNQLYLTRYLKSRGTDVLGTMSRTRKNVPQALKDLKQNQVARGDWHARHCGDIALVTWKDVKLVTVLSTYHSHEMVPGRRAGVARDKPVSVRDYNKYMGGVDLKDQKLSTFLFERKRCHKWYMKVFRRLVNTSLLNAFIIYTKNPTYKLCSHRDFRRSVAEGLFARFGKASVPLRPVLHPSLRLQPGKHFPVPTEKFPNSAVHRKFSCARCKLMKRRTQVRTICLVCQVPLCIGECWLDYHSRENLTIAPRGSEQHE